MITCSTVQSDSMPAASAPCAIASAPSPVANRLALANATPNFMLIPCRPGSSPRSPIEDQDPSAAQPEAILQARPGAGGRAGRPTWSDAGAGAPQDPQRALS